MALTSTPQTRWNWTEPQAAADITKVRMVHISELREASEDMDARLDDHIGFGGTTRHPIVTDTVEGFMSTDHKKAMDKIYPNITDDGHVKEAELTISINGADIKYDGTTPKYVSIVTNGSEKPHTPTPYDPRLVVSIPTMSYWSLKPGYFSPDVVNSKHWCAYNFKGAFANIKIPTVDGSFAFMVENYLYRMQIVPVGISDQNYQYWPMGSGMWANRREWNGGNYPTINGAWAMMTINCTQATNLQLGACQSNSRIIVDGGWVKSGLNYYDGPMVGPGDHTIGIFTFIHNNSTSSYSEHSGFRYWDDSTLSIGMGGGILEQPGVSFKGLDSNFQQILSNPGSGMWS